jgi:hypothetical protein
MIWPHQQGCLILQLQANLTLFLFMPFKSENLGLSPIEQRQAEIDINVACKSVKEMSNNSERLICG